MKIGKWSRRTVPLALGAFLMVGGPKDEVRGEASFSAEQRGEITGSIGKGLYSKPVWRRSGKGVYVGGYIDFDYTKVQKKTGEFDQHRLIPFIYADVAEGIRFATEIEFEHGGTNNNQDNGDVKVEFAVLDYEVFGEALGLRGGIILSPLGKLNLVHDTPLQDIKERPMVNRNIIPTTLSEAGYGIFGTLYPTEIQKVDYELYLVNGFDGDRVSTSLSADLTTGVVSETSAKTVGGNISNSSGLRNARGSQKSDNNNNKAIVGRLGYSPRLGYELGVSWHHGAYDDAGQNDLTVVALDGAAQFGPLEFLGEWATVDVDKDQTVSASTPEGMEGYYAQANYHFLQDVVRRGSTFTAVLRYGNEDLDTKKTGFDRQRLTYGLNFRPVEDTVFGVAYQVNSEDPKTDNNALQLTFASYF